MSLINLRGKFIAGGLRDPETRKAVAGCAGTDGRKILVREYMNTPDGMQFHRQLVPVVPGFSEIPPEAKETLLKTVVRDK